MAGRKINHLLRLLSFWCTMGVHYQTQGSSLFVSQFCLNINRHTLLYTSIYLSCTVPPVQCSVEDPDPNPDPPDPLVFEPPGSGSGSISQRYGSGSGSEYGFYFHQAKVVRKTLIPTVFVFL